MSKELELEDIKKKIESSWQYFGHNYNRFYKFKKFVFNTSLTVDDLNALQTLKKPELEFNTLEAYISRLLGEFATQEPSITVRAADGMSSEQITEQFLMTMDIVEAHCRHIITDVSNDNLQYQVYNDQLGGGFAVLRVDTDYIHERTFEQKIFVKKAFDPALCFFDPLAKESHKGDGQYCGELSPYTKDNFIAEFGEEAANEIKFNRSSNVGSFNWAYEGEREDIILVADFFYKHKVTKNLVLLSNGEVGLESEYNKRLREYEENAEGIAVPPVIVEKRKTTIETIRLYRICQNKILDQYDTDYSMLPLVFVDGNSVQLRESTNGDSYQMTRPYVYHAEGIQRLRNFAGQTIAQQLQNMVQHKIKVPLEAIPDEYKEAYADVQTAATLVYKQFSDDDPTIRYDPPMEIQQTSPPPILESTFTGADRMTQSILGNYDAVLGIGKNDISGKALQQGAIQSSMASDPYLVHFTMGINRVLEIIVDLIPKYYKTPRTLPVVGKDGKRAYVLINDEGNPQSVDLQYDAKMMQIKVEAGVNTEIEKQVSLERIDKMMASSESFAAFINQKCLPIIIDNLNVRGVDQMKVLSEEWLEEQKAAAEEAKNQPNPVQIEAQTLLQMEEMRSQMKAMQLQADMALKTAQLAIEKQKVENAHLEALIKAEQAGAKLNLDEEKNAAENARTAVEMALEMSDRTREMEEHVSGEVNNQGA